MGLGLTLIRTCGVGAGEPLLEPAPAVRVSIFQGENLGLGLGLGLTLSRTCGIATCEGLLEPAPAQGSKVLCGQPATVAGPKCIRADVLALQAGVGGGLSGLSALACWICIGQALPWVSHKGRPRRCKAQEGWNVG